MRIWTFVAIALCCTFLSGCAEESNTEVRTAPIATTQTQTPAPVANVSATATATPADEKGLTSDFAGTAEVTDKNNEIGGAGLLAAVRTGEQENFDRIVFEFAGTGLPSYHIEYVEKPIRSCGSGDVVPLKGDAWLEIRFNPANAHNEQGEPTVTTREMAPNHKVIKELKAICDFEADVEWVAGVASPNKYRVLELKSPTRLVVDIKH